MFFELHTRFVPFTAQSILAIFGSSNDFIAFVLCQNGVSLGEDLSMEEVWDAGLASYTDGRWSACVDLMEETVRLFNLYEKHTLQCLRDCRNASKSWSLACCDNDGVLH